MVDETELKRDQLLTTFSNVPTEYELSFELKPTNYLNNWASIIHFTNGNNNGNYGDRIPGVWASPYNTIYTGADINNIVNFEINSNKILPLNEWTQVKISQTKFTDQYKFAVEVENTIVYNSQNTLPKNFSNVKVYIGDPWYPAQPGYIRSVIYIDTLAVKSMQCKPVLKVNISGQLTTKNLLSINTTINYSNETGDIAYDLTWDYRLPYFSKISTQSGNYYKMGSIYKIHGAFVTANVNQYLTIALDMTSCSIRGDFNLEIPLKISFNNSVGYVWNQYVSFKTIVASSYNSIPIIKRDDNALKESYSRGIYWDQVESWIYVCMNLYVTTQNAACYVSNSYGKKWTKLDLRVGCVLGHHMSTRELYVIHRNQKTYLMYDKMYKKWLAVNGNDFVKYISNNLNFSAILRLEGSNEQIITFQTQQWMGNEEGLFYRKTANDTWIRRIEWKELL